MSQDEVKTTSEAQINSVTVSNTGPKTFSRTSTRTLADQLQHIRHIGNSFISGPTHPRYIALETQEIFKSLVDLYALHFQSKRLILDPMLERINLPRATDRYKHIARIYVSHWFLDLYATNRDACTRLPLARHIDHYRTEIPHQSLIYDNYLVLLLNSMKPTKLFGLQDSSYYVPYITNTPNWKSSSCNYFNIVGFTYDVTIFTALIRILTDSSHGWQTNAYSSDPLGRPFWLLDWHDGKAYAWFPEDDNYNRDDTNLAFILGVSCTPLLAHRDPDVPKQYPTNSPVDPNYRFPYERTTQIVYHGGFEKRVIENSIQPFEYQDDMTTEEENVAITLATADREAKVQDLARKRRAELTKQSTSALVPTHASGPVSTPEIPSLEELIAQFDAELAPPLIDNHISRTYHANMYTITDYIYYCRVIAKADINPRAAAHKILIYID